MNMLMCQRLAESAGIRFTYIIHSADFIQEISSHLAGDLFGESPPIFDMAVMNLPYRKICSDSAERKALRSVGIETSNLYTGFIALMQRLLPPGGQLVGITPRSFCNGPYFRSFRKDFLNYLELRQLHVFESRKAAFRDDKVLQENIIFHAVKGCLQPNNVVISSSSGKQGGEITKTSFPYSEIVNAHDTEKFIHIPSMASHIMAKKFMLGLSSSLAALGVSVSTGRVVDFRLKGSLRKDSEPGTVPLLYPCHFRRGTIDWPKPETRKSNAILDNEETRPWLVPSGIYLLTKRFTSKEEKRRLVACLFDPDQVKAEWVGFENHLNYFHASGNCLDRSLAVGLFAFLNSTMVDQYFRRFSGHTQVNATDLRTLAYPNRDTLEGMGRAIKTLDLSQEQIDALVTDHLHGNR
jgi:adenine-specific DNA-methyltransferase